MTFPQADFNKACNHLWARGWIPRLQVKIKHVCNLIRADMGWTIQTKTKEQQWALITAYAGILDTPGYAAHRKPGDPRPLTKGQMKKARKAERLARAAHHPKKKAKRAERKKTVEEATGLPANLILSRAFYDTDEWKRIRYQALKRYGASCQCCGNTRMNGVIIHVDHIKPKSKFPELALSLDNLQILCEPCNIGKSNIDSTDWR